jgi:hypothetical protein
MGNKFLDGSLIKNDVDIALFRKAIKSLLGAYIEKLRGPEDDDDFFSPGILLWYAACEVVLFDAAEAVDPNTKTLDPNWKEFLEGALSENIVRRFQLDMDNAQHKYVVGDACGDTQ